MRLRAVEGQQVRDKGEKFLDLHAESPSTVIPALCGETLLKESAAYLFGCHITPLLTASTHIKPDPTRSRKLLLHQKELNKLYGAVDRKGYTVIPLQMYWKHGRAKLEIALAKGKKEYDKRASDKEATWQREKQRILQKKLMAF